MSIDLSKVKEQIRKRNPDPRSEEKVPTPLAIFLRLYLLSKEEGYINYMEGAKCLYHWLKPIPFDRAWIDYLSRQSQIDDIPDLFRSYHFVELAKIIAPTKSIEDRNAAELAIYLTILNNNWIVQ